MINESVGGFFDTLTSDYTETIERCFPRYREMLWALIHYLPADANPKRILDLGCGTGNLSVLLASAFPDASITCVDLARESLDVCRERLLGHESSEFSEVDMSQLQFSEGHFDLIASSIAIHHLDSEGKRNLFTKCRNWLAAGGIFTFADQCRGASDELYRQHIDTWREQSLAAGGTPEEFSMWMQHQRAHDHHDRLFDQLRWIEQAGFESVDCTWRYLLWSVIQARKPCA